MKIYKHYFEQQFEDNTHTLWLREKRPLFMGHRAIKIKLLGVFTVYRGGEKAKEWTNYGGYGRG